MNILIVCDIDLSMLTNVTSENNSFKGVKRVVIESKIVMCV